MASASAEVMTDCLSIPLILREVFQCFSTKELIQLSLVNKQWNYEARSLMKNRGNLIASVKRDQTCQHLGAFASDLRRMKEINKMVPFSGMTISLLWRTSERNHCCQQTPNSELQSIYQEILGGLTWKHFSVRILLDCEELKYCVAFILVKKILENFASVLEDFSIEIDLDATKNFMRECLGRCSFSRLQTFRLLGDLEENEGTDPEYIDFIKLVVSLAPNLQAFNSTGQLDLHGNLLEGSSAVHVAGYPYSICSIPESLIANQLRFQELHLFEFYGFSLERFNDIISKLLHSSRTVLSKLGFDVVFLVPLMVYGICLENLSKFTMGLDLDNVKTQSHIWSLVKSFDFTRMFPKLNTVRTMCVHHSSSGIPDDFNEIIEQANAISKTTAPDKAVNIKRLKLQYLSAEVLRQRSSFQLLAEMFPHVQKLTIKGMEFPFAHIGDIWADLKEVDVRLQCPEYSPIHLDSAFCGIFPEEVAHLREQDEEYLRRVNIVPVMPSIGYLKELRTLTVCFGKDFEPVRMFSKVSGLIAFQRCPNLTVTLTAGDERLEQAMSHLRAYAAVLIDRNYA